MIAALFIIATILMVAVTIGYLYDEKKDSAPFILLGLAGILVVGVLLGNESPKSSKKKITPKIRVECEDNKCDTTYIYE